MCADGAAGGKHPGERMDSTIADRKLSVPTRIAPADGLVNPVTTYDAMIRTCSRNRKNLNVVHEPAERITR